MHQVDFRVIVRAPREETFAKAANYERFFRGGLISYSRLVTPGDPAPNGLGAVREVKNAGVRFVEKITHFEPGLRLDYQIVECTLPIVHEGGRADFHDHPKGTEVRWTSRYRVDALPLVRHLLEWYVDVMLRREIKRLFRLAEEDIAAGQ